MESEYKEAAGNRVLEIIDQLKDLTDEMRDMAVQLDDDGVIRGPIASMICLTSRDHTYFSREQTLTDWANELLGAEEVE